MPAYKLTFGDRVLYYDNFNNYLTYGAIPVQRYEYSLYHNPNGIGVSAGNLASATSAFDEIIVGVGWQDNRYLHGIEYNTFQAYNANGTIKTEFGLQHYFSNNSNFYMFETKMDVNNNNLTFTCSANTANYWALQTTLSTTAAILNSNLATARLKCVTDIIGVKYQ